MIEKICRFYNFLKSWIKRAPVYFATFILIALVGMFSTDDFLSKALTFLLIDISFEYLFANYLIIEKYRARNSVEGAQIKKFQEASDVTFNEDYFTLYSEMSRIRLGLFLRVTLFFLMMVSYLPTIKWLTLPLVLIEVYSKFLMLIKGYFIWVLGALMLSVVISALLISKTQNQYLEELLLKKSNDFTPYTVTEKEVLSKIKYKTKEQSNEENF